MKQPGLFILACRVCVLFLLVGWLFVLAEVNAAQKSLTIDINKDVEINISQASIYSIQVRFLHGKLSPAELGRVLGAYHKNEKGEWVEPGIPASYRVVIKDRGGNAFLDRVVKLPKSISSYEGRYANIVTLPLSKETYVVRVEVLEASEEVARLSTEYLVTKSHHGK